MSQEYKNPLSNLSYTNKDFQTVYKELLDLVKELTNKWNPSISNESDPGVILLKLNALIADKCNYNIDKNVLECFPVSVTQLNNARKLFEQLGYYMHWAKSATTDVVMQWIGDSQGKSYTIPAFTMVSDYDGTVVYTLIGNTFSDSFSVGSQKLNDTGEYISFKAIQGIAVKYDINGETLITPNMLDSENRIYFPTTDIAENGIFICNANTNNYSSWVKKDNLLVESLGNKFYKFGTTQDQNQCYIEFPLDSEQQFDQGINITYIKTDGQQGNISANIIEKFYNDLVPEEDNTITLNSENVKITNYSSATDGSDYETINDAYDGYKRVVGTFNTLVTLRDYINYINRSGLVSNNFVCDRHNDIQCSYKVMSSINGVNQEVSYIEQGYSEDYRPIELHDASDVIDTEAMVWERKLNAFNIKVYALQYQKDVDTENKYNKTFDMLVGSDYTNLTTYIEDVKSINHDIAQLLPADELNSHIAYFLNVYPINATITSQYFLTESDKRDIRDNIKKALYQNLNSKEINFGEAIKLDYVQDIIINSDSRIKNVSVSNIEYTTYACILEKDELGKLSWKQIDISKGYEITADTSKDIAVQIDQEKLSTQLGLDTLSTTLHLSIDLNKQYCKFKPSGLDYVYYEYLGELDSAPTLNVTNLTIYKDSSSSNYYLATVEKENISWTDITSKVIVTNFFANNGIANRYYLYYGWKLNNIDVDPYEYGITISGKLSNDLFIDVVIPRALQIREEIYAKSVLAGVTPFYIADETFDYQLCQKYDSSVSMIDNISKFSMWRDLSFRGITNSTKIFKLPENSSIQLFAPNLIDDKIYSNNVKFEYRLRTDLSKETSYQLGVDEYIIFYWKEENDAGALNQYAVYAQGNIITSSFTIPGNAKSGEIDNNIGRALVANCVNVGVDSVILQAFSATQGDMSWELSSKIDGQLTNIFNKLSGTKKVSTKKVNQIKLSSNVYCYWILNNINSDNQYELFSKDGSSNYILDTGEYFLYTDNTLSYFSILGAGTTIARTNTSDYWAVPVMSTSDIINNGLVALKDSWFTIPLSNSIIVTENQYLTIGSNYYISFKNTKDTKAYDIIFDKANVSILNNGKVITDVKLSDFEIHYGEALNNLVKLPNVDLTTYLNWEGKSIYAVNTSFDKEQFAGVATITEPNVTTDVGSNISYSFVVNDSQSGSSSEVAGQIDVSNNLYFMTSVPVDAINANNIDVTQQDRTGVIKYMSLYVYGKYENIVEDNYVVQYLSNGDVTLTVLPSNEEQMINIPVKLFADLNKVTTYILPIQIDSVTVDGKLINNLSFSYDGNQLHSMYSYSEINFANNSISYVYFPIASVTEGNIQVNISAIKGNHNVVITLKNILKYNLPSTRYVSENISNESISRLIGKMNSNGRLFDYTYQVSSDYAINNPLAPESFFKSNHIYNPFVISKLDTTDINLAIINS